MDSRRKQPVSSSLGFLNELFRLHGRARFILMFSVKLALFKKTKGFTHIQLESPCSCFVSSWMSNSSFMYVFLFYHLKDVHATYFSLGYGMVLDSDSETSPPQVVTHPPPPSLYWRICHCGVIVNIYIFLNRTENWLRSSKW